MNEDASPKRAAGRFYTRGNPFGLRPFRTWARRAGLPGAAILEPFAGANHLIHALQQRSLCREFRSYDVAPGAGGVRRRDTLAGFPRGFDVCITNPPWLARNSATRRGLPFPHTPHDNLYKHALELCLQSCAHVAALVPESFIRSGLFLPRLHTYISLPGPMFCDTEQPVGLALFDPDPGPDVALWENRKFLGKHSALAAKLPPPAGTSKVRFNAPDGNVGLIALDNHAGPTIRFCRVSELCGYRVKHHCRHITKLRVPGRPGSADIAGWNHAINRMRRHTHDMFLTAYRGLRKDGRYRRRLDWRLARDLIHAA